MNQDCAMYSNEGTLKIRIKRYSTLSWVMGNEIEAFYKRRGRRDGTRPVISIERTEKSRGGKTDGVSCLGGGVERLIENEDFPRKEKAKTPMTTHARGLSRN